jgi:predicted Zn-dependent protease
MKAEFWHATGLICVEQEKWDDAEHAFQKAVLARPLNKLFRSRYCEILRRLKKNEEEMIQAEKLEKVIRIAQASINPLSVSDRASLLSIAQMCIEVDAADVAPLVTAVAGK